FHDVGFSEPLRAHHRCAAVVNRGHLPFVPERECDLASIRKKLPHGLDDDLRHHRLADVAHHQRGLLFIRYPRAFEEHCRHAGVVEVPVPAVFSIELDATKTLRAVSAAALICEELRDVLALLARVITHECAGGIVCKSFRVRIEISIAVEIHGVEFRIQMPAEVDICFFLVREKLPVLVISAICFASNPQDFVFCSHRISPFTDMKINTGAAPKMSQTIVSAESPSIAHPIPCTPDLSLRLKCSERLPSS